MRHHWWLKTSLVTHPSNILPSSSSWESSFFISSTILECVSPSLAVRRIKSICFEQLNRQKNWNIQQPPLNSPLLPASLFFSSVVKQEKSLPRQALNSASVAFMSWASRWFSTSSAWTLLQAILSSMRQPSITVRSSFSWDTWLCRPATSSQRCTSRGSH